MDRINEIKLKIYEAITKVLLHSKMTWKEKQENLCIEEQGIDPIVHGIAIELEEIFEDWQNENVSNNITKQ